MVQPPRNESGMFFLASLGPTTSSVFIRIVVVVVATSSYLAERCSSSLPPSLASPSPLWARSLDSYVSPPSVLICLASSVDVDASDHHLLVGADPDRVDDALASTVAEAPRALRAVRSSPARLRSLVAYDTRVSTAPLFCALPSCVC